LGNFVLKRLSFRVSANDTGWRSADNRIPSRPAAEVDYLSKVQVIEFAQSIRSAGTKAETKNQKMTNVFRLPAFVPT
jgi:hypothetical protein